VLHDHGQVVPGELIRTEVAEPEAPLEQVVLDGLLMLVEEI